MCFWYNPYQLIMISNKTKPGQIHALICQELIRQTFLSKSQSWKSAIASSLVGFVHWDLNSSSSVTQSVLLIRVTNPSGLSLLILVSLEKSLTLVNCHWIQRQKKSLRSCRLFIRDTILQLPALVGDLSGHFECGFERSLAIDCALRCSCSTLQLWLLRVLSEGLSVTLSG